MIAVSFAAGLNVYATVATLGLLSHTSFLDLPPSLHLLSNWGIIAAALILFGINFFIDKIPAFDLVWNALHTFIRVPVAALLAFQATAGLTPAEQLAATLAGGAIAFIAHGGKTAVRAAVTPSPEPFSNIALSLSEDGLAIFLTWLSTWRPYIAATIAFIFILITLILIRFVFRALRSLRRRRNSPPSPNPQLNPDPCHPSPSPRKSFTALLEPDGTALKWVIARVPFDIAKAWPVRNGRRVRGEIAGHVFRTSLFPDSRRGGHFLLVNKKMQSAAEARVGSRVNISLEPDLVERPVSLPPELTRALNADRQLRRLFDSMSDSRRREFGKFADQPKSPAARIKRAGKIAECSCRLSRASTIRLQSSALCSSAIPAPAMRGSPSLRPSAATIYSESSTMNPPKPANAAPPRPSTTPSAPRSEKRRVKPARRATTLDHLIP